MDRPARSGPDHCSSLDHQQGLARGVFCGRGGGDDALSLVRRREEAVTAAWTRGGAPASNGDASQVSGLSARFGFVGGGSDHRCRMRRRECLSFTTRGSVSLLVRRNCERRVATVGARSTGRAGRRYGASPTAFAAPWEPTAGRPGLPQGLAGDQAFVRTSGSARSSKPARRQPGFDLTGEVRHGG